MSITAMKQALECIRCSTEYKIGNPAFEQSEAALRQAIEQAEKQEPVGEVIDERGNVDYVSYVPSIGTKLYTTPQPQQDKKPSEGGDCDSPSWCNQYGKCHRKVVGAPTLANCMEETEKQEPVAWRFQSPVGGWSYGKEPPIGSKYAVEPLYTQPQREWVGLTNEETQQAFVSNSVMVDNGNAYMVADLRAINIGRAIEAKLKEKNT